MKKGFCVGHYEHKNKLNGRVFVFMLRRKIFVQNNVKYEYKIKITFNSSKKFNELEHLLSREYTSKNYFSWEVGLLKDQIMPELNRLKSVGFNINECGVSEFMSELV